MATGRISDKEVRGAFSRSLTMPNTKTRRGVYKDLKHSDYIVEVDPFVFHFSSEFYRRKFYDLYEEEMDMFNMKYKNMYRGKYALDMATLSLLRLYTLIEKRGFYIKVNGVEVTCPNHLSFVLDVEVRSMM